MLKCNNIFSTLTFIFLINYAYNVYSQEQLIIDSIQNVIANSKDSTKISAIISLGDVYEKSDFKKAINYYQEAFNLCIQYEAEYGNNKQMLNKLINLKSVATLYIGVIYSDQNDYKNALIFLNKAKDIATSSNNYRRIVDSENNIGNIYNYTGEYEKANSHYLNALKISESQKYLSGSSRASNNLGIIHYQLNNYNKSIEYFNISYDISLELNDKIGASYSLNNIGNILLQSNKLDSALNYFQRAKTINEEVNDWKGLSRNLNNLGIIYKRKKEFEKALKYYDEALQINLKHNDNQGTSSCLNNIGTLHYVNKRYDLAIEYAKKNLEFASKTNLIIEIRDAYNLLTESYWQKKDYKSAYDFLKLSNNISDSIYNQEKTKAITEMDAKYQNEKKQLQIDNLNKDYALKASELATSEEQRAKQKIIIYTFIFGFITILIFSILLFRLFRQIKKANIVLSRQKKEIEEKNNNLEFANAEILQQKEEILTQSELLEESNKELEKLSIAVSETDNSIIIADNNGNIEWANSGFTKLFGYSIHEFKEIHGSNIINASSHNEIKKIFNDCLKTKKSVIYVSLNKTKYDKHLWIQTTLTPILDSKNEISKFIAIDSDISKIKDAENEIIKQKELIENQNKEITDSINYACNIQTAILPPEETLKELLVDYFILFKPKNIVSGDFYWTKKIITENDLSLVLVSVADCTGHGVPGALMSMLGISLLNEITNEKFEINKIDSYTGSILDKLKDYVIKILHQTGNESDSHDGIDMALCLLNINDKTLYYSGANNPIYIASDKSNNNVEIIEFKSDKSPIGYNFSNNFFTNNKYTYKSGDLLYLFSDGFADQFGGLSGKKIKYSGLKAIINDVSKLPTETQHEMLNTKITEWMNPIDSESYSQIDDITILGIKL